MIFILPNLAVGTREEAGNRPPGIDALLCVAAEKDIPALGMPGHKVPIVDMQPIPAEQLREAVEWIRDHITETESSSSATPEWAGLPPWSLPISAAWKGTPSAKLLSSLLLGNQPCRSFLS
jgi:hypothetical protein